MFSGIHRSLAESPLRFVVAMLLVGTAAVAATLLLNVTLPSLPRMMAAMIGGVIGPVLSAPLMWIFVVSPMRRDLSVEVARFRSLLEAAPDGILGLDAKGHITIANASLLRMFGYSPRELIGEAVERLVPMPFAEAHVAWRQQYIAHPTSSRRMDASLTVNGLHRNGSEVPVEVSLNHLHTSGDVQVIAVVRDVAKKQEAALALRTQYESLQVRASDLERRETEVRRISEMSDMLQSCDSEQEAFAIFARYSEQLFPGDTGLLYLTSASRNILELHAQWGTPPEPPPEFFAPGDCWAMRRGRMHVTTGDGVRVPCRHVTELWKGVHLCMPLVAHGETMGVIHLFSDATGGEPGRDDSTPEATRQRQRLLLAVSGQIGLALANLRFREALRYQSIRDPLTGLFNRRFLDEWLERELRRAERDKSSVALLMLDLDHFKRFNDSYGHEGGDAVLREVGKLLQDEVRTSDIACRFGGEELAIVAPATGIAEAEGLAERVRRKVEGLVVLANSRSLGRVTVSVGVATSCNHEQNVEKLIRAADHALYRAKHSGRNCVVTAGVGEHEHSPAPTETNEGT